jgi:hypothetical protein
MRLKAGTYVWVVLLVGILTVGVACTKAPDDSQLNGQIQSKLSQDSGLQGKPITVQTARGVVTLSGTVENDAQRTTAARLAAEVPGIKQVVNNLQMTSTPAELAAPAQEQTAQMPPPEPARPAARARPSATHRRVESSAPVMATAAAPAAVAGGAQA